MLASIKMKTTFKLFAKSRPKTSFPGRHLRAAFATLMSALIFISGSVQAQFTANEATSLASDFLAENKAREATAILAEAARRHPTDRKVGALLYCLLRDKRWAIGQTLPVKLSAGITVLSFSNDGKLLIAGAENGKVKILNTETGVLMDSETIHPAAVVGVAILPGNELAFSVGKAGVARIWRIADGTVVREWSNPQKKFTAHAVSRDWRLIALGYENGETHVYSRESGEQVGAPVKQNGAVTALCFSRDNAVLAIASADGTARIWDLDKAKPLDFVVKHGSPITSLDLGPKGILLLTASKDGTAKITDATSGAAIVPEVKCGAGIRDARLSPSGIRFHTILDDQTVRIWDSFSGEPVEGVIRSDDGIANADWGPAGMRVVTASDGIIADIWRVRDGVRVSEGMRHEAPVRVAEYGPNAQLIATGCADGTVRVWRQDVGASSTGLPTKRLHRGPVNSASFSADGLGLVSSSDDKTVIRWDLKTVQPLGKALAHPSKPVCATYSADRKLLATITESGDAFLFDGETGQQKGEALKLGGNGRWIDIRQDGSLILATAGKKALVFAPGAAIESAKTIELPGDGDREIRMARFSPDGKWIATAASDGAVVIWDATTFATVATLKKHTGAATSLRFSRDGKLMLSTGEDGSLVVWDTATWQQTGTTAMLPGGIRSAIIGPNKQFVAAISELSDGIRVFDIATGRPFTDGIYLDSPALTLDIHPSGDVLVVACADSSVRTYGSPFVSEDTPSWMPDYAEKVIGLRAAGPERFAAVYANYDQLKQYPPANAPADSDFSMLAKWMNTSGSQRTTAPRTFATIASNIEMRVLERSLESLYEYYEAAPSDPLILAAMSLFVPTQRQGEFLAEFALARSENQPLAQAYVASTFVKYGRTEDAERVIKNALKIAPNDHRVLRRAAKIDARLNRADEAIAKYEKAVAAEPQDAETFRSYGWSLYNMGKPGEAMKQFQKADELNGGSDEDCTAGLSLAAAGINDLSAATASYKRLIGISENWADADYVSNLQGWSKKELTEMERIRKLATESK